MTRSRLSSSTIIAAALSAAVSWTACNYGSVDPPDSGDSDDAPGQEDDDDGGGGGAGGPDAGGGGGGGAIEHLSFPIESGTTHAGLVCSDCHSDLANPTDTEALACTGCHTGSHDQATMDSTHAAGPGVGPLFEWSSPACITCHPQASIYRRSMHDDFIREDGHDNVSCSGCHPAQTDLTPSTFGTSQCGPCHNGNPGEDD